MSTISVIGQSGAAVDNDGSASSAGESCSNGTMTISHRWQQVKRGTGDAGSGMTYAGGYCLSYAVCFPLFALYHMPGVPTLTSGFVDGAKEAHGYLKALRESTPTS